MSDELNSTDLEATESAAASDVAAAMGATATEADEAETAETSTEECGTDKSPDGRSNFWNEVPVSLKIGAAIALAFGVGVCFGKRRTYPWRY